jgi:hypothetical protein
MGVAGRLPAECVASASSQASDKPKRFRTWLARSWTHLYRQQRHDMRPAVAFRKVQGGLATLRRMPRLVSMRFDAVRHAVECARSGVLFRIDAVASLPG